MEAAAAGLSSKSVNLSRRAGTEVGHEHPVHGAGRQWRCGLLKPGQGGPVRTRYLGRQRCLKDRQGLPQLERSALQLAKDPEDLIRGPLLDLLRNDFGRTPAKALAEPQRGWLARPTGRVASFAVRVTARRGRSFTDIAA